MRIAILTNAFPPSGKGGAAVIAAAQKDALERAGFEVRVWNPEIGWFSKPAPVRLFHHFIDLLPNRSLEGDISDWKPDVLLTHNVTGCGFATPARIRSACGARWMHVLHDVQLFDPGGRLSDESSVTMWQTVWSKLRQRVFDVPDLVISPTQWLFDAHVRRGFFENTVSEILPNPGPAREFVMRHPQTPIKLLFVGQLYPEKGLRLLVELSERLSIPFEMHVAGEGRGRAQLVRAKNLVLHNRLDPQAVLELMKECDMLLVPSEIAENQPTVILEAASVGLPVIASEIGGIPETLEGAGELCRPGDVVEWEQAVRYLSDPAVYASHAARMYDLAERHDPERYGERLVQLLTSKR